MTPPLKSLLVAVGLTLAGASQAQVSLSDKTQLLNALSANSPCCVIDGRAAASRRRNVLEDALPYRRNLQINATATVVVIADRDQDALGIANALGRRYPGTPILAVKGGLATWRAASLSLLAANSTDAAMSGGRFNFVIPANTCEQGTPLQVLRPDRK